jgi:hypothetical protein
VSLRRYGLVARGLMAIVPVLLRAGQQVGGVAPSFTLPNASGVNYSLTDYRGDERLGQVSLLGKGSGEAKQNS